MPVWVRELKCFGIRRAYKPQQSDSLSGVVAVTDEEGKGYAYIRYNEALVERLGKKMPYGVGPAHPCYLRVVKIAHKETYRIFCSYLDETFGLLLWEQAERPAWLGKVKRGNNNGDSQAAQTGEGDCNAGRYGEHPASTEEAPSSGEGRGTRARGDDTDAG